MRAKEVLAAALRAKKMTQVQAAKIVGMPEQSLGQKVNVRESIRANEFFDLLEAIGIETIFVVKDTGEVLMKDAKRRERVVGTSDGVSYDTKESTLVSSSFFADGKSEYGSDGRAQELYVDAEGRYFVAEFSSDVAFKPRVRAVPANMAEAFINQYGRIDGTPV